MAGIYRERRRAIFKAYVQELGYYEALDTYNMHAGVYRKQCRACGAPVHEYSEWNETGYEYERCSNGCWSITTYGLTKVYKAKEFEAKTHFSYYNESDSTPYSEILMIQHAFKQAIESERKRLKRIRHLAYRKKG